MTKKVISISTGFYHREHLCLALIELPFILFPTHLYILKATHLNYSCTLAAKPKAQPESLLWGRLREVCHGKEQATWEDKEESFSWVVTEDEPNSGNWTWKHGPILGSAESSQVLPKPMASFSPLSLTPQLCSSSHSSPYQDRTGQEGSLGHNVQQIASSNNLLTTLHGIFCFLQDYFRCRLPAEEQAEIRSVSGIFPR